ncbi:MAG TPA: hypothetical protein VGF49_12480 [Candidatus Solibacter sp.]
MRKPAWCALSACILLFYFWTATSSYQPFHPRDTSREFYNQLTDSLTQGKVYLAALPSPQLLALRDPYDPAANERFRLHDASLYRGRYYLYFGIAPALTLYVPWRLMTGKALSDDVAVTLFCMGGYVFSCLLLFLLLELSHVRVHWILQAAAAVALGLGQAAPALLRRPRVYEVAVTAGYCFLFGSLYFMARRVARPGSGQWAAAMSAIFLGLATASRPHCGIVALFLALFYAFYLARSPRLDRRNWMAEFAPFAIPLGIAGLLIGWYNYIRFENPLDFGVRYQVGVFSYFAHAAKPLAIRIREIVASLYYALVCLPTFRGRFPFLELSGGAQPFGSPEAIPEGYFHEPVAGILTISPLCLAGFLLPLLLWKKAEWFKPGVRAMLAFLVFCGFVMLAAVTTVPSISARYELDFVPAFLVGGLFLCLFVSVRFPMRWMRAATAVFTITGCLWSASANMAVSVNSYGYPLEQPYSRLFASIATGLGAGPNALMKNTEKVHLDATITFPNGRPETRETILASGIYERWDMLLVQYEPGGKATLALVHCGVSDTWSPWITISPGRPYHLTVDYSAAAGRMLVRLDGVAVMDVPAKFYPTSRDRVTIGRMQVGRFEVRDFSGKIDVPSNGLQFAAGR